MKVTELIQEGTEIYYSKIHGGCPKIHTRI